MLKYIATSKLFTFLLVFTVIIAFINYINGIRHLGYTLVPTAGILDEYSYVWQGVSIRKEGIPVAWSIFYGINPDGKNIGIVKDFSLEVNGKKLNADNFREFSKPIVAVKELDYGIGIRQIVFMFPFLDHPPLGGLLMSLGMPQNAKTFTDITLEDIRLTSLKIAIIVSFLIFILTYLLTSNPLTSGLAVVIYSTVPTYLLVSRYALLENIIAPFALLQIILLVAVNRFKSKYTLSLLLLLFSGINAGLIILIKETGIGFALGSTITLLAWRFKFKTVALTFIAPVVIICCVYLLWALQFSPSVLLQVLNLQSARDSIGSLNFLSILSLLKFDKFPLDGWWIWGFISLIIITLKEHHKYLAILIPTICQLLVILLGGGPNFPWYYLNLIPFLAILIALELWDIYKSPTFTTTFSFLLVPLSSSFYWGYSVLHLPANIWVYRLLFVTYLIIVSLKIFKPQNQSIKVIWATFCIGLLILLIRWNITSLYFIIANFGKLPFS